MHAGSRKAENTERQRNILVEGSEEVQQLNLEGFLKFLLFIDFYWQKVGTYYARLGGIRFLVLRRKTVSFYWNGSYLDISLNQIKPVYPLINVMRDGKSKNKNTHVLWYRSPSHCIGLAVLTPQR